MEVKFVARNSLSVWSRLCSTVVFSCGNDQVWSGVASVGSACHRLSLSVASLLVYRSIWPSLVVRHAHRPTLRGSSEPLQHTMAQTLA